MQPTKASTNQVQQLLATHPDLLGEEALHEPESCHVVHCMQCELQFQVEIDALSNEDRAQGKAEENIHITHIQQGM